VPALKLDLTSLVWFGSIWGNTALVMKDFAESSLTKKVLILFFKHGMLAFKNLKG
jgi:hypothetical protein